MTRLYPIDTPEQREGMAWRNRRISAKRLPWPRGRLETCERLDTKHPGWVVLWLTKNTSPGFERPAGFIAIWAGPEMVPDGDTLRRQPDGTRRRPAVFGVTVAELEQVIRLMNRRIAAEDPLARRRRRARACRAEAAGVRR